jgi:hypothetical protein
MGFEEFRKAPRSQKYILGHLDSRLRVKLFTSLGANLWQRSVDFFVVGVRIDQVDLLGVAGTPGVGQFNYNPTTNTLIVYSVTPPDETMAWITHRHFLSNLPVALPWDLASGDEVDYQPRIKGELGDLKLELDYENTGIALETTSNIQLENTDGNFDDIFDTHIWEGRAVTFYSWGPTISLSEKRLIYRGSISEKAFTSRDIRFNFRDDLAQLRQKVGVGIFDESMFIDQPDPNLLNSPRRIVFGQVSKLQCAGLDKVVDGYPLAGTVSGSADRNLLDGTVSGLISGTVVNGSGTSFLTDLSPGDKVLVIAGINEYTLTVNTVPSNVQFTITGTLPASFSLAAIRNLEIENNLIVGTGTSFINELSPDDQIIVVVNDVTYTYSIDQVIDNVTATLTDEIEQTFTGQVPVVQPSVPYRRKNRLWEVAGHKLRALTAVITAIESVIDIEVDDAQDLRTDDGILIGASLFIIKTIYGNKIRINQGLPITVLVGDTITLVPIKTLYGNRSPFVYPRDFSIVNNSSGCQVVFTDLAEFNVARSINSSVQLQFTPGSPDVVSITTDVDLNTIFKPRDWVRPREITAPQFYEVLSVETGSLKLRTNYSGPSFTGSNQRRSPDYLTDDSIVAVDAKGMESDGEWVRTPAKAVRKLIELAGITDVNEASFDEANEDCDFDLSLFYPSILGQEMPDVRDMITDVNKSVFGSLFVGSDFLLRYSILNADKDEALQSLSDDDIIGFSVTTKNNIVGSVALTYRPETNLVDGSEVLSREVATNDIVADTSASPTELDVKAYLFNQADAQIIANRWALFRSLSQSVVTVNAKLELIETSLNDRMYLNLTRLFKRFGSGERLKIGIVNSVSKDGINTQVRFNDLGNVFNRVGAIAVDDAPDYLVATPDDIAKWCYIVDNKTETPNSASEQELGNNLIG